MNIEEIDILAPVFKKIKYAAIHCTGSREGQKTTAKQLIDFFKKPVAQGGRGWNKPGYAFIIHQDGKLEKLIDFTDDEYMEPREITNGVANINSVTISFAYVGGCDKDGKPKNTMTVQQEETVAAVCHRFAKTIPGVLIAGHNEFPNVQKACPSFSAKDKLRQWGIPAANIYKK